jgi:hypothetical protein
VSKTFEEVVSALSVPFSANDVAWRIQHTNSEKTRGLVVPYIKSRAIQARLDSVVGPYNWRSEYKPWHSVEGKASQLCGIAVYCEERGEWIQKWDGAENTDIEPVKGGISDAFKRAAVVWGIGRYLYGLDALWVDVEVKGKTPVIPDKAMNQLKERYEKAVKAPPSKPANVSKFPSGDKPPEPGHQESMPYEYSVRSVQQRKFASGNGMVLKLKSADGKPVEAFLQTYDQNLAEGVCLKNVKLTPFESGGYSSHIMEGYEVA